MRFLYHLRCQAHHAIRRRTTLEPAIYTHSMVYTRTCISRWEPHDEVLLVGHQLQMVIVHERDINYKTILVCLACREREPASCFVLGWMVSPLDMTSGLFDFCSVINYKWLLFLKGI